SLVRHLRTSVAAARKGVINGLWPREDVTTEQAARIQNLADAQRFVMWPKLFRRLVSYFHEGHIGLGQFDSWMRDDPIRRDDTLRFPEGKKGNMHDRYLIDGDTLKLRFRPEDLLITPDPSPSVN